MFSHCGKEWKDNLPVLGSIGKGITVHFSYKVKHFGSAILLITLYHNFMYHFCMTMCIALTKQPSYPRLNLSFESSIAAGEF